MNYPESLESRILELERLLDQRDEEIKKLDKRYFETIAETRDMSLYLKWCMIAFLIKEVNSRPDAFLEQPLLKLHCFLSDTWDDPEGEAISGSQLDQINRAVALFFKNKNMPWIAEYEGDGLDP